MQYKQIALGGTFDHFHSGHAAFLRDAASHADHLVIGITAQSLLRNKLLPHLIEEYPVRKEAVAAFCRSHNWSFELLELIDVFGPTLTNPKIEALFVTPNTLSGAEAINLERRKRGLSELHIEKAELLLDEVGNVISSERIRLGEINRSGKVYSKVFDRSLLLNEAQRKYFSKPQGPIVEYPAKNQGFTIVVGDTTLEYFIENNWQYDLGIFDYIKKRLPYGESVIKSLRIDATVTNPAQSITQELVHGIKAALNTPAKHILVNGEEDLAAVAAVLLASLESTIYYGQPDVGIVQMTATEDKKNDVLTILTS